MKELWTKLSKSEKIHSVVGASLVILGAIALFTETWPMGLALVIGGAYIVYSNVA